MKRLALLLGLELAVPSVAQAQLPIAAPRPTPTASAEASSAGPVPGTNAPPADAAPPGDEYFVEAPPQRPATEAGARQQAPFEPPLPPESSFEPPPPPPVRHVAPQSSLWLGVRLGWFLPFGNVWARAKPVSTSSGAAYALEGVPWRDYASSGPMFELDAGARLSRAYTLFALWERAQLGSGRDNSDGTPDRAESDFWAVGLRASSNPDDLSFLTEVAVGYRRARSFYTNGVEVQFTDAPFEARLGLGAELRMNRWTSLSGLLSIGVGGFGTVERVAPNGNTVSKLSPSDGGDGHGWATLSIGGHFDLLPSSQ
jgi:hypothetical protein